MQPRQQIRCHNMSSIRSENLPRLFASGDAENRTRGSWRSVDWRLVVATAPFRWILGMLRYRCTDGKGNNETAARHRLTWSQLKGRRWRIHRPQPAPKLGDHRSDGLVHEFGGKISEGSSISDIDRVRIDKGDGVRVHAKALRARVSIILRITSRQDPLMSNS